MQHCKLPIVLLAVSLTSATTTLLAQDEELEFDEARLFFELNDTDGDLGIHGKVDGDAWKRVVIEGPNDRSLMRINVRSGLKRQGMTELVFESAEPCFPDNEECEDPLDPDVFFTRFPQGEYEWEGLTLDDEEIEGEVYLSHIIPAAPVVASVGEDNDGAEDDGCWDAGEVDDVVIDWDPVTGSHATLGTAGPVTPIYYEFVAEIDGTDYKSTSLVPPGVTEWTVPEEFIDLADGLMVENDEGELEEVEEIKFEILVRVETGEQLNDDGETIESRPGNKSAVESCFDL